MGILARSWTSPPRPPSRPARIRRFTARPRRMCCPLPRPWPRRSADRACGSAAWLRARPARGSPRRRAWAARGRREPARLGQRVDELDRVGGVLVVAAMILGRKLAAEVAKRLAHLLVRVGLRDHHVACRSSSGVAVLPRPSSARIASVCSPSAGTGSRRGSQPSPLTGSEAGEGAGRRAELRASGRAPASCGMRPERRHVVDPRGGDAGMVEARDRLLRRQRGEHAGDHRLEHVAVAGPAGIALEPRDRPARSGRSRTWRGEGRPFAVVLEAEEDLAIGGGVGAVGIDGGVAGAGARRRRGAVEGEIHREAHPLGHRLEHRDLDVVAAAGAVAVEEGGEDRVAGGDAAGDVGDRDAGLGDWSVGAGDREEAGLGLDQQVVGLAPSYGPPAP